MGVISSFKQVKKEVEEEEQQKRDKIPKCGIILRTNSRYKGRSPRWLIKQQSAGVRERDAHKEGRTPYPRISVHAPFLAKEGEDLGK